MSYQNYNYTQKPPQRNNNTGLIVAITILICVFIIALTVIALIAIGAFDKNLPVATDTTSAPVVQQQQPASQPQQPQDPPAPQPIPVNQTMYVDCNTYLSLRTGPATSYPEITEIPVGSSIYVIEYTNNEFARATYGGYDGFVSRKYISSVQPYVWNYNDADVENFVENSVRGYVHAINTGDTSFASDYFTGSAVSSEISSVTNNRKVAESETILSLDCHSVTRVSKTKVTVIRDSNIRVYYHDGNIKDVVEKYKYTVEYINGRMYITSLSAV